MKHYPFLHEFIRLSTNTMVHTVQTLEQNSISVMSSFGSPTFLFNTYSFPSTIYTCLMTRCCTSHNWILSASHAYLYVRTNQFHDLLLLARQLAEEARHVGTQSTSEYTSRVMDLLKLDSTISRKCFHRTSNLNEWNLLMSCKTSEILIESLLSYTNRMIQRQFEAKQSNWVLEVSSTRMWPYYSISCLSSNTTTTTINLASTLLYLSSVRKGNEAITS